MMASCMPAHLTGLPFTCRRDRQCSRIEQTRKIFPVIHHSQARRRSVGKLCPHRWSTVRPQAAGKHNPQNVPDPEVMPDRSFSPEDAVAAQLTALQGNDQPWVNHGIQTMYEFAQDVGGMERSIYFGPDKLKDLYHFDHFMGLFQNSFGELIGAGSFDMGPSTTTERGNVIIPVTVQTKDSKEVRVTFVLRKKDVGRKKGCWMTLSLLPHEK